MSAPTTYRAPGQALQARGLRPPVELNSPQGCTRPWPSRRRSRVMAVGVLTARAFAISCVEKRSFSMAHAAACAARPRCAPKRFTVSILSASRLFVVLL